MRKGQQQQIIDLLKTIKQAQGMGLFADCQDGAVFLCDFIDGISGEGTRTAALLRDYCDLILKAKNGEVKEKHLSRQLIKIENSVGDELKPNKIEAAFFPYNASMADSLESIFLAANEDPMCDAYWVPVPYYDFNPDHTLGQMYYHGAKYPDYMQAVDWESYDLNKRRPDIIFFHNPYDKGNIVTRVHPDFHAERLMDFTGMLVYIPYFVAQNYVQEHFCVSSGTIFSDKVILQNEAIRQDYINVFSRWAKKSGIAKNHPLWNKIAKPQDKFQALGSPKFDKILNSSKDDFEIPEEWRGIIDKAQKCDRKIVLYNARLTDLTAGPDDLLAKVRETLEYFKGNEEILIWWRPHPLNESSLLSMSPQHLREYLLIVDTYKNSGLGIYDDTDDLHRAIAFSDLYYGDLSSLIPLYNAARKPAMIQNLQITPGQPGRNDLIFSDFYDDGENLWASGFEYNALFKISKTAWEAQYMGSFPGEPINSENANRLFSSVCCLNGKLYFAPRKAQDIGIYDIAEGEFSKIVIKRPDGAYIPNKFSKAIAVENLVCFIPFRYPAIIIYDTVSGELSYIDDWVKAVNDFGIASADGYFLSATVSKSNKNRLILPCSSTHAIAELDCITKTTKLHRQKTIHKHCKYSDILQLEGQYWLLRSNGDIEIVSDFDIKGEHEIISLQTDNIFRFNHIIHSNGCIWAFAQFDTVIYKIECKTRKIEQLKIIEDEMKVNKARRGYEWFILAKKYKEGILAINTKSRRLMEFSGAGNIERNEFVSISQNDCDTLKNVMIDTDELTARETSLFTFEDFIKNSKSVPGNNHHKGTAGENIYQYIKNIVMKK